MTYDGNASLYVEPKLPANSKHAILMFFIFIQNATHLFGRMHTNLTTLHLLKTNFDQIPTDASTETQILVTIQKNQSRNLKSKAAFIEPAAATDGLSAIWTKKKGKPLVTCGLIFQRSTQWRMSVLNMPPKNQRNY